MKKALAIILCLVLAVSCAAPAFADNYKESIKIGTMADLPANGPYGNTSVQTSITTNSTFNGLVTVLNDGTVIPELATSWESNEDCTEWTFHLREGVKFHDGSDFTAEDVKFTWEYATSSENPGISCLLVGFNMVDEMVVSDPLTITFKLNTISPDWLMYAAQKIMSKTAVEEKGEEGCAIGTGPFYFDSYNPGVSWTIKRFDDYWGEAAPTKEITFIVAVDASARALSLRSGDVDAIFGANASDIVQFMEEDAFNVYQADNLANVYLGFNWEHLGDNEPLRKAIAMGINRDDIVIACYEDGKCGRPSYNIINDVSIGYADVEPIGYDPEAAKALVEEYNLGATPVKLTTFASYIPLAEVIQADLAMVGINVEITEIASSGFTGNLRTDRESFDMYINATSSSGGLLNIVSRFFEGGTSIGCMFYEDPEFDAKLNAARASTNYDDMIAAYAGLQQHLANTIPAVALCQVYQWCIGTKDFAGVDLANQSYDVDFSYSYVTVG